MTFRTSIEVGVTSPIDALLQDFDAVVLSGGAEWPRNLDVTGRELDGIHYRDGLPDPAEQARRRR